MGIVCLDVISCSVYSTLSRCRMKFLSLVRCDCARDMPPRSAGEDVLNAFFVDAKLGGKRSVSAFAGAVSVANQNYVAFRELRLVMLTAWKSSVTVAALVKHVSNVVALCAKDKVVRVDTRSVVARVHDYLALRNWPIVESVGKPVRSIGFSLGSLKVNRPISGCGIDVVGPLPTSSVFVDGVL